MRTIQTFLFFCAIHYAAAAPVNICLVNDDAVRLNTIRYMEASLMERGKELNTEFRFTCDRDAGRLVIVRLRDSPSSAQPPNALGTVLVIDGKVVGQVEVFCGSVMRMVATRWPRLPAVEGWALATVAAHEMYHYLFNEHDHHHGPLNEQFMNADGLLRGFHKLSLAEDRSN